MTSLTLFNPIAELPTLQREVNRLFEEFFPIRRWEREGELGETSAFWTPRADLAETDDAYLIFMDLPGVPKENVKITFEEGMLKVSGERPMSDENVRYYRIERPYGRFFRTFTFARDINPDKISASYENGVLTITVPKAEESKPVRIEIK